MNMKATLSATALALTLATSAHAATIALTDASLEAPLSGTNGDPLSGWWSFNSGAVGQAITVSSGFWTIANNDGDKAMYIANDASGIDSVYQSVTLEAGITYRLTAAVAQSANVSKNDANVALAFFNQGFSVLEAQNNFVVANQSGSFVDYFVEFTPDTTGIYQVGLRNAGAIIGTGTSSSANGESTVFFDNVRLESLNAVPEPSSTALLGLGSLALILRRRK
ncbi:PEP-CTERM sorting domain-containing protein [Sulfuriroseicoccus oceanibius]|uniref:PEP-CTERM sorting domain-containing protein n=1 Tax=Sulfuriroseicoccus oceanibius TaxID=2707525 RepID=UPI001F37BA5C|nr:PEP-CTERM sorting domain-containing protein [Sulfuriroseicoccus oceanibius]